MSLSLSHGKPLDPGSIGVPPESLPAIAAGPIDLKAWFGPDGATKSLELEIGSGKGTFLVQHAAQLPGVNFIGIEWAKAFWLYAADRCRRHGLNNVRLVRAEAGMFFRCYVPDGCLRQVHIYFPDPWPKTRHHKRRLIQTLFLHELHRVLEPGGMVHMVTDHDDYFAWMEEHVAQVPELFERLAFATPSSAGADELVGSNFERKYRREGRPFHALALRKRAGVQTRLTSDLST